MRPRWVHPLAHQIFKFFPSNPPRRGDIVTVDGVRCRVLRSRLTWDGPRWTLHGIKVRAEP